MTVTRIKLKASVEKSSRWTKYFLTGFVEEITLAVGDKYRRENYWEVATSGDLPSTLELLDEGDRFIFTSQSETELI